MLRFLPFPRFLQGIIVAVVVAIGMVSVVAGCTEVDVGEPEEPPLPTQPATEPTSTSGSDDTSEGSISLATPDDATSLESDTTVEGTLAAEAGVTPPALLPGTVEPTPPVVRSGTTPESEGPAPTETPTSPPPQTEIRPTDTPVPVPPTDTPEPPAEPTPPTGNRVGQSAPDFEVTTTEGVTRSLTDFKQANQPIVLYFFSST